MPAEAPRKCRRRVWRSGMKWGGRGRGQGALNVDASETASRKGDRIENLTGGSSVGAEALTGKRRKCGDANSALAAKREVAKRHAPRRKDDAEIRGAATRDSLGNGADAVI